jgi:mannose-6-phosphate isomerase-like protein (cupin superfamily)
MDKINLNEKFSLIDQHYSPRIISELNGQLIKLVKFSGPFPWHHHETEDEMFLVTKGRFRMEFLEPGGSPGDPAVQRDVWLEQGEMIVVPHGVEHRPVADEEVEVMLFEPASTLNTGNVRNEFTVPKLEWL